MADLTPGAKVLKYLILLFNFVFFLCGIVLICIGAAVSIKFKVPAGFVTNAGTDLSHALGSAPIGCIIAGIIIISIVMFGCFGAYKEASCLIGLFAGLLLICCVIEFGSAAAIASWKTIDGAADDKIRKGFNSIISKYDQEHETTTKGIDTIQMVFKCCGSTDYNDWANATHLNPNGVGSDASTLKFPNSCCGYAEDAATDCKVDAKDFQNAGCLEVFKTMIEDNASIIIGAGVTIGLIQILGVIFSCLLIRKIRGSSGYEPQFNNYS